MACSYVMFMTSFWILKWDDFLAENKINSHVCDFISRWLEGKDRWSWSYPRGTTQVVLGLFLSWWVIIYCLFSETQMHHFWWIFTWCSVLSREIHRLMDRITDPKELYRRWALQNKMSSFSSLILAKPNKECALYSTSVSKILPKHLKKLKISVNIWHL